MYINKQICTHTHISSALVEEEAFGDRAMLLIRTGGINMCTVPTLDIAPVG